MLFVVLSCIVMYIGLKNFKNGFLMYLLLQMIWFPDTQLFKLGGSYINLNFIVALYFTILFIVKRKNSLKSFYDFPYLIPLTLVCISMLLTSITSLSGFFSEFLKACGLIVMDCSMIFIIWKTVKTRDDFKFLFKGLTIIILVACIYIFIEYLMSTNLFLDYKLSCTSNNLATYTDLLVYDYGRGYRCYSIFEHPIGASMIFALYIIVVFNLLMKFDDFAFKKVSIITAVLCLPAILMTKQRAGIFFLFFGLFSALNFKNKKTYRYLLYSVGVLILLSPIIFQYKDLILSMFHLKTNSNVSGSTASMRFDQLDAVFNIMKSSPLLGLGENFRSHYTGPYLERALGFESLWFEQMAKHGILGLIAYLYFIYISVVKIPLKFKSRESFFIMLSYWITYSLTSTPYFRIYFLYVVVFYFLRFHRINSHSEKNIMENIYAEIHSKIKKIENKIKNLKFFEK